MNRDYDTRHYSEMLACARASMRHALTAIEADPKATLNTIQRQQLADMWRDYRALRRVDREHFAAWRAEQAERRAAA